LENIQGIGHSMLEYEKSLTEARLKETIRIWLLRPAAGLRSGNRYTSFVPL